MNHHGPGNGHDRLDGSFCNSIVMVGSNSSKLDDLLEVGQMLLVLLGGEAGAIVRHIGLWDNTRVAAMGLKRFLAVDCLVGVQMNLFLDEQVPRGVVDEECTAGVLRLGVFFSESMQQSASCGTYEVVNRNVLAWEEVVVFQCSLSIDDGCPTSARRSTTALLPILATGAHGDMCEATSGGM